MDHILVWGEPIEEHNVRLERLLKRAMEENLKFNPAKYRFK